VGKTKRARAAAGAIKKAKSSPRPTISSSSPLGMLALCLLEQWRQSGHEGIVFLAENENRAERLGSVLHSLDPSLDVLVFPRLNTLPFDGLEPSREIAGRRALNCIVVGLARRVGAQRPQIDCIQRANICIEFD
jgi:transcription-repair coupling factor (superfamily II helicase)